MRILLPIHHCEPPFLHRNSGNPSRQGRLSDLPKVRELCILLCSATTQPSPTERVLTNDTTRDTDTKINLTKRERDDRGDLGGNDNLLLGDALIELTHLEAAEGLEEAGTVVGAGAVLVLEHLLSDLTVELVEVLERWDST